MRERASKRLILNARLYASMPTSRMAPPQKGVTFAVVNTAPAHGAGDAPGGAAEGGAAAPAAGAGGGGGGDAGVAGMATYALRLKTADAVDTLLALVDTWKAETASAVAAPPGSEPAPAAGEAAV